VSIVLRRVSGFLLWEGIPVGDLTAGLQAVNLKLLNDEGNGVLY